MELVEQYHIYENKATKKRERGKEFPPPPPLKENKVPMTLQLPVQCSSN